MGATAIHAGFFTGIADVDEARAIQAAALRLILGADFRAGDAGCARTGETDGTALFRKGPGPLIGTALHLIAPAAGLSRLALLPLLGRCIASGVVCITASLTGAHEQPTALVAGADFEVVADALARAPLTNSLLAGALRAAEGAFLCRSEVAIGAALQLIPVAALRPRSTGGQALPVVTAKVTGPAVLPGTAVAAAGQQVAALTPTASGIACGQGALTAGAAEEATGRMDPAVLLVIAAFHVVADATGGFRLADRAGGRDTGACLAAEIATGLLHGPAFAVGEAALDIAFITAAGVGGADGHAATGAFLITARGADGPQFVALPGGITGFEIVAGAAQFVGGADHHAALPHQAGLTPGTVVFHQTTTGVGRGVPSTAGGEQQSDKGEKAKENMHSGDPSRKTGHPARPP